MKHEIRIPLGKPRNPFGDDYEGSHNAGRHESKKDRYRPDYEAIVEEEESYLYDEPELNPDDSEYNWLEYLASQGVAAQTGKVTPK